MKLFIFLLLFLKTAYADINYYVEINIEDGWHIYYEYPGSIGSATRFYQDGKEIKVTYPIPKRLSEHGYENFIYYGNPKFIVNNIDHLKMGVGIKASYILCKDVCIPKEEMLEVKHGPLDMNLYPKEVVKNYDINFWLNDNKIYFKAYFNDIIALNKNLVTKKLKNNVFEIISSSDDSIELFKSSKFLLIDNNSGFIAKPNFLETSETDENELSKFIKYALYGIIGGLILNFMPCVLPILAIKFRSISRLSDFKLTQKYTLYGIYSSFILLASIVSLLKYTTNDVIGWGFHFQNIYFVIFMASITFLLGLSFFGIIKFAVPQFAYYLINKNYSNKKLAPFLEGMLATLLATPCTAPFLGSAVGYALSEGYNEIFTIFLSIATGFSLPYFFMLLVNKPIIIMPSSGKLYSYINYLFGAMMIATSLWLADTAYNYRDKNFDTSWEEFSEERIKQGLSENKTVIVDITAKWCITCQYNKKLVLENKEVTSIISNKNKYLLLRGDITVQNNEIMEYLSKHKRKGVPFNAIYKPDDSVVILPEILTVKIILSNFKTH